MYRRLLIPAAALLALGATTDARAGSLSLETQGACFDSGASLSVAGSGWTPDLATELSVLVGGAGGFDTGTPITDETGAFFGHGVSLPEYGDQRPRTVTIAVRDQVDPNGAASVTVQQARFGSNFPLTGKVSAKAQWRFAGFATGATIYGHYRTNNRTVKTVRFGKASGPCGTLSVRARRIPVTPKRGSSWYLQIDARKRFSARTAFRFDTTFTVR